MRDVATKERVKSRGTMQDLGLGGVFSGGAKHYTAAIPSWLRFCLVGLFTRFVLKSVSTMVNNGVAVYRFRSVLGRAE